MVNPYLQYQEQRIQNASPGERVVMLYDGAVRFLEGARAAMDGDDVAGQQSNLDRAQSVLLGLVSSLNLSEGGELAYCLLRVYEYCYNRLCDATAQDDVGAVREVCALLGELRGAWVDAAAAPLLPAREMPAPQVALTA